MEKKNTENLIYPELSYVIVGLLFSVHNELGEFAKEKQYGDLIEKKLTELKLPYKRETRISDSGNILDFLIDDKIVLEIKTIRFLNRECFRQIQNYLQQTGKKLGILVNFRTSYLKPIRVIKIDQQKVVL